MRNVWVTGDPCVGCWAPSPAWPGVCTLQAASMDHIVHSAAVAAAARTGASLAAPIRLSGERVMDAASPRAGARRLLAGQDSAGHPTLHLMRIRTHLSHIPLVP